MNAISSRNILDPRCISPEAAKQAAAFHPDIIQAVEQAIHSHSLVVVGMAQNPWVKKTRKALDEANLPFTYLEYGSYFSRWKERLAIKIWSGWATFPQVFVRGVLIGGHNLTVKAIGDGALQKMLAGGAQGVREVLA